MTEIKHTPTPWVVDGFKIRAANDTEGTNGRGIAETRVQHNIPLNRHPSAFARQSDTNKANAAHIVKCVNMHNELVEALKALHLQALQSNLNSASNDYGMEAIDLAHSALKKAGAL